MVPHVTIRTAHTTYAAALKTTTHPKTRRRKPYDATEYLMLLMMGLRVPETCRAKNTSIKLPSWIKLAFHFISSVRMWVSSFIRWVTPGDTVFACRTEQYTYTELPAVRRFCNASRPCAMRDATQQNIIKCWRNAMFQFMAASVYLGTLAWSHSVTFLQL